MGRVTWKKEYLKKVQEQEWIDCEQANREVMGAYGTVAQI